MTEPQLGIGIGFFVGEYIPPEEPDDPDPPGPGNFILADQDGGGHIIADQDGGGAVLDA